MKKKNNAKNTRTNEPNESDEQTIRIFFLKQDIHKRTKPKKEQFQPVENKMDLFSKINTHLQLKATKRLHLSKPYRYQQQQRVYKAHQINTDTHKQQIPKEKKCERRPK